MADGHHHHPNYFMVFIALCVCTALSVGADLLSLDNKLVLAAIVMAIASAKALFVMMYFMHLKFEGKWKFILLAPTVILAIGLPLALLPDVGVHYYTVDVPQDPATGSAAETDEHVADGHGDSHGSSQPKSHE
ncbi:MAG: oxidase [Planctomycetaceae bacterium]|nr:oxidase [Planctomycetaceae bacterium]